VERRRKSKRIWTSTSADVSESVLPVTGSARFRKRERVQDDRPRASRVRAKSMLTKEVQSVDKETLRFAEEMA
jgi:hypothetical protein